MIARRAVTLSFALVLSTGRSARAEHDVRLWLEPGVQAQIAKKTELAFDLNLRFFEDVSRVQAIFPELNLSYRLHKNLKAGLGYRLQWEVNNDDFLELRHLFVATLRPRYRFGPVELSYRLRYQNELRGTIDDYAFRHTVRNRLAIAAIKLGPWQPSVAAETYHRFFDDDETVRFRKLRLHAGVQYDFSDHQIEVYYRTEVLQEDPDDPTPHILGIGYRHML